MNDNDELARLKQEIALLKRENAALQEKGEGGITARDITAEDVIVGVKQHIDTQIINGRNETDPDKLRTLYLRRVIRDTDSLSLQGIDPKAATCEAEACMKLDAVYTALLTHSTDMDRPDADHGRMGNWDRLSALALLDRHPCLALLGDPGSGKTTFVNFVARCLAGDLLGLPDANISRMTRPLPDDDGDEGDAPQPWSLGPLLPVRVILRDFAAEGLSKAGGTAADLWNFIEAELGRMTLENFAPHLKTALHENGGLILLDGLDEIPEAGAGRERLKAVVADFQKSFGNCRILLTSRTYAYQKQDWRLPGFHETVLAPFSKGQIIRFIDRWYDHIAILRDMKPDDALGKAKLLKRAALSTRRMRELAARPLLLTLMASLHAWRGGNLPEKREELYADAVELLLDRWEGRKVEQRADGQMIAIEPGIAELLDTERDQIRSKLNELAYDAHAGQPELQGTADISEKDLVYGLLDLSEKKKQIQPRELIRFLAHRAGLLIQRGVKVYTFPHRTFQEYLAACHLTDLDYPIQVADLARSDPSRWREVALLAGAKAARGAKSGVWSLAGALCFQPPDTEDLTQADAWGAHLAGQALAESADLANISQRNREVFNRVRVWLVRILSRNLLTGVERAAAGRNLAALGDPRKAVMRLDGMRFCRVPGGPFQMGSDEYDDEKPPHENKCLKYDYWISQYPVTNAQYAEFVKAGGYNQPRYWKEAEKTGWWRNGKVKYWQDDTFYDKPIDHGSPFNLSNHPVVGVTWYEALAFTRWLTDIWQERGVIPAGSSVRLPSEAEWEKAARGGLEIPRPAVISKAAEKVWDRKGTLVDNEYPHRVYPWGDEKSEEKANYDDTGIGTTSAVGCFPSGASPYGCLDMSGNVWEWTRSIHADYPYDPEDGREDEMSYKIRVMRGGAFRSTADSVRCALRNRNNPNNRNGNFGFRCCVCAP